MTEHVPAELVRDFDCFRGPDFARDPFGAFDAVRDQRVFWSPHNGGHWVLTQLDDIREAYQHPELFSSARFGLLTSAYPRRLIPEQLDPPEHGKYRQLLAPLFSPAAAATREGEIRQLCAELIGRFADEGRCELQAELARPLPAVIFLRMLGLPPEDADTFVAWNHALLHSYDDPEDRVRAGKEIAEYLGAAIAERNARGAPDDDIISTLLRGQVDGRPVTVDEVYDTVFLLYMAGLDTVTAMLSFVFRFLAEHEGHRRQLVEDPALIPEAVEELMRAHAIVSPARVVTRDIEFAGVQFRSGDMVLVSTVLACRDPVVFLDPEQVVFGRSGNRHLAFGAGPHRCLGSNLARIELRIALEEFHRRIPDYRVADSAAIVGHGGGVLGIDHLPLTWAEKGEAP